MQFDAVYQHTAWQTSRGVEQDASCGGEGRVGSKEGGRSCNEEAVAGSRRTCHSQDHKEEADVLHTRGDAEAGHGDSVDDHISR